jgi:hypothetical protein
MFGSSANGGIAGAARRVAEHANSVVRLQLELAALEIKKKVVAFGIGIALAVGAVVFALLLIGFLLAAATAGFATFLPIWAALLVMAGILLVLTAACVVLAIGRFKKGSSPLPTEAIREAKLTSEAIRP